ncbi:MAG: hypothetical protein WBA73_15005 [Devosia sp.]
MGIPDDRVANGLRRAGPSPHGGFKPFLSDHLQMKPKAIDRRPAAKRYWAIADLIELDGADCREVIPNLLNVFSKSQRQLKEDARFSGHTSAAPMPRPALADLAGRRRTQSIALPKTGAFPHKDCHL